MDSAGTLSYGAGVNPASSDATDVYLGGAVGSSAYTVSGNAASALNGIFLQDNAAVTDTLNFTLTGSNKVSFGTGGASGTAGPVIEQDGSSVWDITNGGGATAPIRLNNSLTITGAGSGNVNISAEIANVSGADNFSVNETGGATIALSAANVMGGAGKAFTLTAGTLDFQNSQALGVTTNAVNFNGGALESTTGNTLAGYTGITLGGNLTFTGSTKWSTGSAGVTVASTRTIIADTGGTTGATIGGAITGAGGLTIDPTSTGIITLTNSGDAYGGATNVNGGTLLDNGNITTSSLSVGTAGTLGGNGSLGAMANIGGAVAPGATSGTIGALNFLGGVTLTGSYDDDVDNAGSSDELAVTGNINLLNTSILNVNVLDSVSGGIYTIATYSGSLVGSFGTANVPNGYSVDYGTGSDSAITLVAVVPEPGSLGILCVGGLGLVRRRRKVSR